MTIAVDLGRKATKQTNKQTNKRTRKMRAVVGHNGRKGVNLSRAIGTFLKKDVQMGC